MTISCCIKLFDTFVYLALAWYLLEVWPSTIGVSKPADFILRRSFWFTDPSADAGSTSESESYYHQRLSRQRNGAFTLLPTTADDLAEGIELNPIQNPLITASPPVNGVVTDGAVSQQTDLSPEADTAHPSEPLDTDSVSDPTISVHSLRKTYDKKLVVNHVRLDLHENQIFALLGHNGAGKVL